MTILDTVARAMFEDFMDWQFGEPLQWDGEPPVNAAELERDWRDREWVEQSEFFTRAAKAAIAAMRTPTDAMKNATYMRDWEAVEIWEPMIDAAIAEAA